MEGIAPGIQLAAQGLWLYIIVILLVIAGASWAVYNCVIGALLGAWLAEYPVIAVVVSVLVAIALGVVIDAVAGWISRRKTADGTAL